MPAPSKQIITIISKIFLAVSIKKLYHEIQRDERSTGRLWINIICKNKMPGA